MSESGATDVELSGTVTSFDEHVGLGEVTDTDGGRYLFHCVEIADGSRTIDVGALVRFTTMSKFGKLEASSLRPV
ncbi:MAG: hypothetical protein AAGF91_11755 [Actinomycetota bacterium]